MPPRRVGGQPLHPIYALGEPHVLEPRDCSEYISAQKSICERIEIDRAGQRYQNSLPEESLEGIAGQTPREGAVRLIRLRPSLDTRPHTEGPNRRFRQTASSGPQFPVKGSDASRSIDPDGRKPFEAKTLHRY